MISPDGAVELLKTAPDLLLGLEADHHEVAHTEQELRMLLFATQATGSFSFNQLLMVENLFDLSKQTVRDAMMQYKCVSGPGDVLATQEFVFKIE